MDQGAVACSRSAQMTLQYSYTHGTAETGCRMACFVNVYPASQLSSMVWLMQQLLSALPEHLADEPINLIL